MWIHKLNLTNFRNYQHLDLELPPHLVVFYGDNAQGKTNLLEAIWILSTTKSHRTSNEKELVSQAAVEEPLPVARLFTNVHRENDEVAVELVLKLDKGGSPVDPGRRLPVQKRVRVNGVVRRSIDVMGQINTVLFNAQDIDIIAGPPVMRRRYLDLINSQVDSHYRRSLQQYQKVLWQRNRLLSMLQQHRAQVDELDFWNKQLVESGSYLIAQRRISVGVLNELIPPIHDKLCGSVERLSTDYMPSVKTESSNPDEISSAFHEVLARSIGKEIAQGKTLVGPHRDDLRFQANGVDMSVYGSRGQQRTVTVSLRLAEAQYLEAQTGDSPILLLDDVLPELDKARRRYLLEFILSFQQVLVTATDLDSFESFFLAQVTRFTVSQGEVWSASESLSP